ncbi:MAG: amidohydrolase [Rhodospirillaceae bacterium]|nr:MAG: amidohydrolase [Rhodospirillaceae bacterium]
MGVIEFDLIPVPAQRTVPADSWRPPADIRMISADDHNLEMDHLYEERLPAKFKDRAPKFYRDKNTGLVVMEYKGRSFAPPGIGTIGHECPGFWDIGERLRAMDSEGIAASVLYHGQLQSLNAIIGEDPELYTACADAYNEWLIEYTRPAAKRLMGVAMLPAFLNPATAHDQMQKLKQLGYRAVMMPSYPKGIRYNSREMDPVWSAIEESGIPLSFHVTAFQEFFGYGSLGANLTRNLSPFRPLLGQLTFSGVFDRHPNLKVVFAEGGATWVADALVSMDFVFRSYYSILRPQLPQMPSYYWKKQCFATFMNDPIGMEMIDRIGADNVMWSLDYPHPESVYGYAGSVAKSIYDTIGHEKAKKVLGGNAARLYGL